MARAVAVGLVALLALSLVSACKQQAKQTTTQVTGPVPAQPTRKLVPLAFAGPLTGPNAVYGQEIVRAVRLAVDQANRIPDVVYAGYRFELSEYDDKSDPKTAQAVAQQIIKGVDGKPFAGVVGHFDSSCSMAASGVYHKADLLMVSLSSDPQLTAQGFSNVFRIVPRDDEQGIAGADVMTGALGKRSVAVVNDGSTYGVNLTSEFVRQLERDGGSVALRATVSPSQTDFSSLGSQILGASPGGVYFAGSYKAAGGLSKRLSGSGYDGVFMGGDTLFSKVFLEKAGGTEADGDVCTALGLPLAQQPGYTDFFRQYRAKYPDRTPGQYDPYAFDAAWVVMDSVVGAGVGATRVQRIKYTHTHPFDNVTGQAVFNSQGDTSNQTVSAYRVEDGAWKILKQE